MKFQVMKSATIKDPQGRPLTVRPPNILDLSGVPQSNNEYWHYIMTLVRDQRIIEPLPAVSAGPYFTHCADPLVFWGVISGSRSLH